MPKKILIIRNDKLGDFMLAYPSYALAKLNLPDAQIHALVPDYTRPMAEACPWIDKVIRDPGKKAGRMGLSQLVSELRNEKYDAAIALFSTTRIGLALWLAGINYRLAPANKIAQFFFNNRERQKRSQSAKPEFDYNTDLVRRMLSDLDILITQEPRTPYLKFSTEEITRLRKHYCANQNLNPECKLVVVHPGSGGSSNNLSLKQYADLCAHLLSESPLCILISAGPGEEKIVTKLAAELDLRGIDWRPLGASQGLQQLAKLLAFTDCFIAGSTGPLHIAGALNTPTVGFYPSKQSSTPLRWQTLAEADQRLAFCPPENADQSNLESIDVVAAAAAISKKFLQATPHTKEIFGAASPIEQGN